MYDPMYEVEVALYEGERLYTKNDGRLYLNGMSINAVSWEHKIEYEEVRILRDPHTVRIPMTARFTIQLPLSELIVLRMMGVKILWEERQPEEYRAWATTSGGCA